MKNDTRLTQDILAELKSHKSLDTEAIQVIVKDGVVTLSGEASDRAQKAAITRVVEQVPGVEALAVDMKPRRPASDEPADCDVARWAERLLTQGVLAPPHRVRIVVEQGWLTLHGEVERDYQSRDVERALRNVPGAIGITNLIHVQSKAERGAVLDASAPVKDVA